MKILIFGLPGTGKSTLAEQLNDQLGYARINGDSLRDAHNDWDFSIEGRLRQAARVECLAYGLENCIIDIVAPLKEMRTLIDADFVIWMNTKTESQFADTNAMFEQPDIGNDVDVVLNNWNYDIGYIVHKIQQYIR
jgi:adenylylsulfate kinase